MSLPLTYIIYCVIYHLNIQSHKEKHFTRQELEHRILYRRYAEQFKLHFRDIQKRKIEFEEIR